MMWILIVAIVLASIFFLLFLVSFITLMMIERSAIPQVMFEKTLKTKDADGESEFDECLDKVIKDGLEDSYKII